MNAQILHTFDTLRKHDQRIHNRREAQARQGRDPSGLAMGDGQAPRRQAQERAQGLRTGSAHEMSRIPLSDEAPDDLTDDMDDYLDAIGLWEESDDDWFEEDEDYLDDEEMY